MRKNSQPLSAEELLPFIRDYITVVEQYGPVLRQEESIRQKHRALLEMQGTTANDTFAGRMLIHAQSLISQKYYQLQSSVYNLTAIVCEIAKEIGVKAHAFEDLREHRTSDKAVPALRLAREVEVKLRVLCESDDFDYREDGTYEGNFLVFRHRRYRLKPTSWKLMDCALSAGAMNADLRDVVGIPINNVLRLVWTSKKNARVDFHTVSTRINELHNELAAQGVQLPWRLAVKTDELIRKSASRHS